MAAEISNNPFFRAAQGQLPVPSVGTVTVVKQMGADTLELSDGSTYIGSITNGQATGVGKRIYPTGGLLQSDVGEFVEGQLHGSGTRYMMGAQELKQVGEFKGGKFWNGKEIMKTGINTIIVAENIDGIRQATAPPSVCGCSLI